MRVVACVAAVPKPAAVKWDRFRGLLDTQDAEPVLNPADRNALELAARLADPHVGPDRSSPSTFTLISAGFDAGAALREGAAFGATRLIALDDLGLADADENGIAAALAAAISHIGGADAVFCGAATSSYGSGAVGGLIAAHLNAHVVAAVVNVARCEAGIQADRLSGRAVLRRVIAPPVVIVASAYGVQVRAIAPMTALRAGRKALETLSLADLNIAAPLPASGAVEIGLSPTRGKRAGETFAGDSAVGAAQSLVGALRERQAI